MAKRRATLLYNPHSGRRGHRVYQMELVAAALRQQGFDVTILATEGPNTADRQAAKAAETADILFACGGDGTVHEVLQGLAFHPHTALGIIPFGSANALARHLRLSLDPVRAARQQIDYEPRIIPLGKVTYNTLAGEHSRYFAVMAGAGADGMLVYKMLAGSKQKLGRLSYYKHAARLFLRERFATFDVSYKPAAGDAMPVHAVSTMAVRVDDLGGPFSPLIQGAAVDHPHLLLTIVKTPATLSLLAWFGMSWARLHCWNKYVQTLNVEEYYCSEGDVTPVQVQADGEWLGFTPMTVTIVPGALRLLMPPQKN